MCYPLREIWQGNPKEAMSRSKGKLSTGVILGSMAHWWERHVARGHLEATASCTFPEAPRHVRPTALGSAAPRAHTAMSTRLGDLEQFIFSNQPWAREGLMKTIRVIASWARPIRKESSFWVEITISVKGRSEAATLLPGKLWNFLQHGELGREYGRNQGKSFLNNHFRKVEGGLLGQDVKMKPF